MKGNASWLRPEATNWWPVCCGHSALGHLFFGLPVVWGEENLNFSCHHLRIWEISLKNSDLMLLLKSHLWACISSYQHPSGADDRWLGRWL